MADDPEVTREETPVDTALLRAAFTQAQALLAWSAGAL